MKNKLICGDNLEALKNIGSESVDLIYIDPPFFSNRNYEVIWGDEAEIRSFEDRWEGGIENYVAWMRPRVQLMYEVLKPTGSFYLHCDWHASHYLKVMADQVFGQKNFRNEIAWCYSRPSSPRQRQFSRTHETLLFYSKNRLWTFNEDEVRTPYASESLSRANRGVITSKIANPQNGVVLHKKGKFPEDWWLIPAMRPNAAERLGYPTQKPEALLERIIKASSNKGDTVLDAFCGCGTTLVVAQKLERNWIGIDISPTAVKVMEKRLRKVGAIKDVNYTVVGMPTTVKELKELKPFEFENWVISEMSPARHTRKRVGDMGLDGYIAKNLWHEETGIQVKQSDGVGRNVIDNFETALKRKKYKKGYIVAFSFSKGAYEEVARLKNRGELEIELIKVEDLLYKKKPIP